MFRQAVQNIPFCNVSRARRGRLRLLVLAGKTEPVLWSRGFLRVRPQICLPSLFSGPNGDLGVGVLSSYRGADWDKVGSVRYGDNCLRNLFWSLYERKVGFNAANVNITHTSFGRVCLDRGLSSLR